jgi:preprotein translocase subunit SecG
MGSVKFLTRRTPELEYLFFFQNLTLGYMTKTLNQIIFFSSTKIRIFFSATLGIRIFF